MMTVLISSIVVVGVVVTVVDEMDVSVEKIVKVSVGKRVVWAVKSAVGLSKEVST